METCKKGAHQYDAKLKYCPICRKEYLKNYRTKNKERIAIQNKNYYSQNKAEKLIYQKAYNTKNKERIAVRMKDYYFKNKDKLFTQRNWWKKDRKTTDPFFKLSVNIRALIYHAYKRKGYKKTTKTHKILCCSFEDLKVHLEFTWKKNYGTSYIGQPCHIDHIIPIASAMTERELLRLNHYTNLQLLTPEDNRIKKDNI
jgi:hypothetical protein